MKPLLKKIARAALVVALACGAGVWSPPAATNLTGNFKHPDGSPVNGKLVFLLSQPARLNDGSAQVVPMVKIFSVTNGQLEAGAFVYGNDVLLPAGTYYLVRLVDQNNNLLFEQKWSIQGTNLDLGTLTPTTTGVVVPDPLLKNIQTDQSVQGPVTFSSPVTAFSLTLNGNLHPGSADSYDLGTPALPWREVFAKGLHTQGQPWFDVTGYAGTTCNGVADDAAGFTAALAAIPATGGTLFVPGSCVLGSDVFASVTTKPVHIVKAPGTLTFNANTTFPVNMTMEVQHGGKLHAPTGVTVTIRGPFEAPPAQVFTWAGTGAFRFGDSGLPGFDAAGTPMLDVMWWGAVSDATTDSSAAFQAAEDALCGANGGGEILAKGRFRLNTAPILCSGITNGSVVWRGAGSVSIFDQLVIKPNHTFIGEGSTLSGALRQVQTRWTLQFSPASDIPAVKIDNTSGPYQFENLYITSDKNAPTFQGIHTAGIRFENSYINNSNTTGAGHAVQLDGVFWAYFDGVVTNAAGGANGAYNYHITATGASAQDPGLTHIMNGQLNGSGILIGGTRLPTGATTTIVLDGNTTMEGSSTALVTIDRTNNFHSRISHIVLNMPVNADSVAFDNLVNFIGTPTTNVRVKNVFIRGQFANKPVEGTSNIQNLVLEGTPPYTGVADFGNQWNYTAQIDALDARWQHAGGTFHPAWHPYAAASASVAQDGATWSGYPDDGTPVTVTTGIQAPDGTTSAFRMTCSSGTCYKRATDFAVTYANGDWVIAGVWVRSNSATAAPRSDFYQLVFTGSCAFVDDGSGLAAGFASSNSGLWTQHHRVKGTRGWVPVSGIMKVVNAASNPCFTRVILSADNNTPTEYWRPFFIRIPAGTAPDSEIIRAWRAGAFNNIHNSALANEIYVVSDNALVANTFKSRVATGTPPLVVDSTTEVVNLNVELWHGKRAIDFSAALDFGSIAAQSCAELTITATGAATNDPVAPSWPASLEAGLVGTMRVSSSDTVTVRLCNITSGPIDPASQTFSGRVVR